MPSPGRAALLMPIFGPEHSVCQSLKNQLVNGAKPLKLLQNLAQLLLIANRLNVCSLKIFTSKAGLRGVFCTVQFVLPTYNSCPTKQTAKKDVLYIKKLSHLKECRKKVFVRWNLRGSHVSVLLPTKCLAKFVECFYGIVERLLPFWVIPKLLKVVFVLQKHLWMIFHSEFQSLQSAGMILRVMRHCRQELSEQFNCFFIHNAGNYTPMLRWPHEV
jgi:hypothetical protein